VVGQRKYECITNEIDGSILNISDVYMQEIKNKFDDVNLV